MSEPFHILHSCPHVVSSSKYVRGQLQELLMMESDKRAFCLECSQLLLPDQFSDHAHHKVTVGLGDKQLSRPSQLLFPCEDNKSRAVSEPLVV